MLERLERIIMMIFKGYFPVMIVGSLIACYFFFKRGDSLMHSDYGVGIVKEIKNKKILQISFESEGDKTIFTAKNNLTKVSE